MLLYRQNTALLNKRSCPNRHPTLSVKNLNAQGAKSNICGNSHMQRLELLLGQFHTTITTIYFK